VSRFWLPPASLASLLLLHLCSCSFRDYFWARAELSFSTAAALCRLLVRLACILSRSLTTKLSTSLVPASNLASLTSIPAQQGGSFYRPRSCFYCTPPDTQHHPASQHTLQRFSSSVPCLLHQSSLAATSRSVWCVSVISMQSCRQSISRAV
jgi:hypothetical protein